MKKNKFALVGLFLAGIVLVGTAARYEDLTATWLRVKNLKKLGPNASITVDDPIIFSSTMTGDLTGDVTGTTIDAGTALTVTNGQALTLTGGTYLVDSVGGADDSTNTVTVTCVVGTTSRLIMDNGVTNLLGITDTGTKYLSGDILLDENDVADLYGRTYITNVVQVGEENN